MINAVTVLFCAIAVLTALSFVFEFDRIMLIAWLQSPLPVWVLISLVGSALGFIVGNVLAGLILAATTAVFLWRISPLISSTVLADTEQLPRDAIKVAHCNLLYLNKQHRAVIDTLLKVDADVLALCEVTAEWNDQLLRDTQFASHYPHRVIAAGAFADGIALFSKLEITSHAVTPMVAKNAIVAELCLQSANVRIITPHPMPPVNKKKTNDWRPSFDMLRATAMTQSSTLIIGDLNAAHWHPTFRRLTRGTSLTHVHAGRRGRWSGGLAPTWRPHHKLPKLLPLDHTLITKNLVATEVQNFDIPGSDHDGLIVSIAHKAPSSIGT